MAVSTEVRGASIAAVNATPTRPTLPRAVGTDVVIYAPQDEMTRSFGSISEMEIGTSILAMCGWTTKSAWTYDLLGIRTYYIRFGRHDRDAYRG